MADTKAGPVRRAVALDGPRPEARERAEGVLADLGYRLVKPWRDGRHTLLPPESRLKTRPGLVADLVGPDSSRAYGVVDLPPEASPGVHCIDCHLSFSSNVAYQLHRPSWMRPCRKPSSVVTVLHGTPMLVRGPGAVWALNTEAVYGPGGCPLARGQIADMHQQASRALKRWQFGRGHNRR